MCLQLNENYHGYLPYEAGEKLILTVSLLMDRSLNKEIEDELFNLIKEIVEIKQNSLKTGKFTEQVPRKNHGRKETLTDQNLHVLQENAGKPMSVPVIAREILGSSIVKDGSVTDDSEYVKIYIPLNTLVKKGKVQKKQLSNPQVDSEGAKVKTPYYVTSHKLG